MSTDKSTTAEKVAMPAEGGSYTRDKNGNLRRTEAPTEQVAQPTTPEDLTADADKPASAEKGA